MFIDGAIKPYLLEGLFVAQHEIAPQRVKGGRRRGYDIPAVQEIVHGEVEFICAGGAVDDLEIGEKLRLQTVLAGNVPGAAAEIVKAKSRFPFIFLPVQSAGELDSAVVIQPIAAGDRTYSVDFLTFLGAAVGKS